MHEKVGMEDAPAHDQNSLQIERGDEERVEGDFEGVVLPATHT